QTTLRLHLDTAKEMNQWRMVTYDSGDVPSKDGWPTLAVQFDDEQQALFVVLGFGSKIEVLAPDTLRERARAALTTALNHYGSATDGNVLPTLRNDLRTSVENSLNSP